MVHEDQQLADILTREAFENAIKTLAAIGGSTNAVIHLIAIAGRIGVKLGIDDFDRLASELPCLVNLQPSGTHLMEDFCYAGGLPAVMKEIAPLLHLGAVTASGKTVGENIADAENFNTEVIKTMAEPFKAKAGIAVLRGNLAPRGAIIKPSAATPALMTHRGRAVVFEDSDDFHKRIDDESLDVDETCILVLKNCGPKGYPGMAEVGNMPLPPKVLRKGITDMVRISDARMSGTAYGTVVLHTAPEAAAGGPLAAVRNGDFIELDVPNRRLHLDISDAELAKRLQGWKPPVPPLESGYWKLYIDHVLQADQGADLDFLVGGAARSCPKTTTDAAGTRVAARLCHARRRPLPRRRPVLLRRELDRLRPLPAAARRPGGIDKAAVAWILMADQLVFVFADYASGVAADRVARTVGRIGGWLLAGTLVSCAAFLALPFVAPGASPRSFSP
jgi:dihydroxy-acid dehydratase